MRAESKYAAKPFIKWAGGKQQLLSAFEDFFPQAFNGYCEPFLGGGAVFFHLWNTGRLPSRVFLSDSNDEIVNVYLTVRDELEALMRLLYHHERHHNRTYYYGIRNLDREMLLLDPVERAARTIYLNRTCFNGLYRVNSKHQFNVPLGKYENPRIVFPEVLETAHQALQDTRIETRDFRSITEVAQPGDFIYFDPPYHPLSATSSFRSYTSDGFCAQDQQDLAQTFAQLAARGCRCMLSNSHAPFIQELYQGFRVETVQAKRSVNAKGKGRGLIDEVVVLNY